MRNLILFATFAWTTICAADDSPVVTAKVKVIYPDREEKLFNFARQDESQDLPLKSKFSLCSVKFDKLGDIHFAEMSCIPVQKNKKLGDVMHIYSTRAVCSDTPWPAILIINQAPVKEKPETYSLNLSCSKN